MLSEEIIQLIDEHKNMITYLKKMLKSKNKKPQEIKFPSERIIQEINNKFNVDIRQKTRKKKVVYARHAAVYLLRTHTKLVWQDIAYNVGNSHHTSVIHSFKAAKDIMDTDDDYLKSITEIKKKLVDLKN